MGLVLEGAAIGSTAGVVSGAAWGGLRLKFIAPQKVKVGINPRLISSHAGTGTFAGAVAAGAVSLSPHCQSEPDEIEL